MTCRASVEGRGSPPRRFAAGCWLSLARVDSLGSGGRPPLQRQSTFPIRESWSSRSLRPSRRWGLHLLSSSARVAWMGWPSLRRIVCSMPAFTPNGGPRRGRIFIASAEPCRRLRPEPVEGFELEARRLELRVHYRDESLSVARIGGQLGERVGAVEEAVHVADGERVRVGVLDLRPGERRRDGGSGARPERVWRDPGGQGIVPQPVDEHALAAPRHPERDGELLAMPGREERDVVGPAQDRIHGHVPIPAGLGRMLLRGRAASRDGEPLDRGRIMRGDVLLEEPRRGQPLRIAADRERAPGEVRKCAGSDALVVRDHVALGPADLRKDEAVGVGDLHRSSLPGQLVGRALAHLHRAPEEVGHRAEPGIIIAGADLAHRGVHPGIEARQLRGLLAQGPDHHRPAIRRVSLADHPAALLQPVEDARDGGRVQRGPLGQRARAQRALSGDQVQAVQVDVVESRAGADLVVEQRELDGQRPQRLLDRGGQAPPIRIRCRSGIHTICNPYYLTSGGQATMTKKDRIIGWTATGIVCAVMVFSILNFTLFDRFPFPEGGFVHLGLPGYFKAELTVAKILGVAALLIPAVPAKIKEFAHFGFAITLVSAAIAHFSRGDARISPLFVVDPLVFLGVLTVSWVYFNKRTAMARPLPPS